MGDLIPNTHNDLLTEPINGVLTTMMPDGQPQMSIVWVDYDGDYVLINTTLERQKGKNMRANPKVNILVIDPKDGTRFLEVRGKVTEITTDGAIKHADKQTQAYSNYAKQHFFRPIHSYRGNGFVFDRFLGLLYANRRGQLYLLPGRREYRQRVRLRV